jgi:hypothetical protein
MKVRIFICVIAALLVFSGASPWEGAAAVAPEGELPATGRYIATNSFPANPNDTENPCMFALILIHYRVDL